MAYFSNGTEGEVLDEQCAECPVGQTDCPVRVIQMLYNYEQFDGNGKRNKLSEVMNILIDEEGECQMRKAMLSAEERMRSGT